jgi:hypothetical protein
LAAGSITIGSKVIKELEARQRQLGQPEERDGKDSPRKVVSRAHGYFTNQQSRMNYAAYRAAGFPITSSYIESTIKQVNRREDIPLLVEHFLEYFCNRHKRSPKRMSSEALQVLMSAQWPGNVRQLRNVVERMVITSSNDVITATELPEDLRVVARDTSVNYSSLAQAIDECEKTVILSALQSCNLHRENTAKALGISVRTLHYKMSRHGLH